MPQRIGEYRDRVIVQKRTETADAAGEPVASWSQHAVRWGKLSGMGGTEEEREGTARESRQRHRFRTHLTRGLGPRMRLLVPGGVTTLTSAVSSATDTSLSVASADAFPLVGPYRARLADELVRVTAGQGTTTWTVERGVDGTTAATYATGQAVQYMEAHDVIDADVDWRHGAETVLDTEVSNGLA